MNVRIFNGKLSRTLQAENRPQILGLSAFVFYICPTGKIAEVRGKAMSILTGAELGGGLPPPGSPTLIQ